MTERPTIVQVGSKKIQLDVGFHYRIRYRKYGGRIILEAVLRYIGTGGDGQPLFSARPRFGTQKFAKDQIQHIMIVPNDTEIYINWDPRSSKPPESWPYAR